MALLANVIVPDFAAKSGVTIETGEKVVSLDPGPWTLDPELGTRNPVSFPLNPET